MIRFIICSHINVLDIDQTKNIKYYLDSNSYKGRVLLVKGGLRTYKLLW
jgi:hypothetical protein